jgi:hypothetical protein
VHKGEALIVSDKLNFADYSVYWKGYTGFFVTLKIWFSLRAAGLRAGSWAMSEMIGSARPNPFMVSGVGFQVSAEIGSWVLIGLQLKTNCGKTKSN